MKVAVLGASPNPDRYSNRAIRDLKSYGHEVLPINPAHNQIEGLSVYKSLDEIKEPIDTLSVYVGPSLISSLIPAILRLKPKRVVLNPGTESTELINALKQSKIPYIEGCTLVMLRTGEF